MLSHVLQHFASSVHAHVESGLSRDCDFDRRLVLPGRILFVLLFTGIEGLLFIVRDLFRRRGFNTDDFTEVPKTFVDADSSGVVHRVGVVWFLSLVSQRFLRLESCTNANLARFLVRVTHGFLLLLRSVLLRVEDSGEVLAGEIRRVRVRSQYLSHHGRRRRVGALRSVLSLRAVERSPRVRSGRGDHARRFGFRRLFRLSKV